jgi:hypothetical protein
MSNDACMDDIPEPATPSQFTGDFFGSYRAEDLEWPLDVEISRISINARDHLIERHFR